MADGRKLDARLHGVLRRNLERIAAERGVSVEDLLREEPGERAAEQASADREWREQRAEVLLRRIPEVYRYAECRLRKSEQWFVDYRGGGRRSFVLLGEVGRGKTWEAYALVRRLLLELSVPASLVTAPDLMAMLRPNDDGLADVGLLQSAPVLVLDDLGAEKLTEWGAEQFERVANFRHDRRMPVIVTSNLTREQIEQRYSPRLVRRLFIRPIVAEVTSAAPVIGGDW